MLFFETRKHHSTHGLFINPESRKLSHFRTPELSNFRSVFLLVPILRRQGYGGRVSGEISSLFCGWEKIRTL